MDTVQLYEGASLVIDTPVEIFLQRILPVLCGMELRVASCDQCYPWEVDRISFIFYRTQFRDSFSQKYDNSQILWPKIWTDD